MQPTGRAGATRDRTQLMRKSLGGSRPSRDADILEVAHMGEPRRDAAIKGKTIQFRWTEGPTKGATHEHVFHEDGTVEWRDAEPSGPQRSAEGAQGSRPPERPVYAAIEVADQAYVVSYLAPSGYTLTVILNFRDQRLIGFASAAKEWYPLRGTFEVVK
jgi:hypothetical protein